MSTAMTSAGGDVCGDGDAAATEDSNTCAADDNVADDPNAMLDSDNGIDGNVCVTDVIANDDDEDNDDDHEDDDGTNDEHEDDDDDDDIDDNHEEHEDDDDNDDNDNTDDDHAADNDDDDDDDNVDDKRTCQREESFKIALPRFHSSFSFSRVTNVTLHAAFKEGYDGVKMNIGSDCDKGFLHLCFSFSSCTMVNMIGTDHVHLE